MSSGRRSSLDMGSVTGGLINEAYDTVKIVADNLDDILSAGDSAAVFTTTFYLPRASEVSVDDSGNLSTVGDTYFNTTLNVQRTYTANGWVDSAFTGWFYAPRAIELNTRDDNSASVAGDTYFNTALLTQRVYQGGGSWVNQGSIPTDASAVSIADAGGYYTVDIVEDALQEAGADLAANAVSIAANAAKIAGLNSLILDIGIWDMNTDQQATVTHGIDFTKVREASAIIMADNSTAMTNLVGTNNAETGATNNISVNSTIVLLQRATGGPFDSSSYSITPGGNRGWVVLKYID